MKKKISIFILMTLLFSTVSCEKKETKIGTKTFDISKNYNICISSSVDSIEFDTMRKGFVVGLKDLGLVEGINATYHYENAKSKDNYASQIAEAFVEKNPDLLVGIGETATKALKDKFNKTPIVFIAVPNAEKLKYCDEDGNPTSNLTGVIDSQLYEEQLDYISKNYTQVKKLGIINTAISDLSQYYIDYFKFYAMSYNIDIYTVSIKKSEDINTALNSILPKVDAITLIPDNIVDQHLSEVINVAKNANKYVFGVNTTHKNAGADVAIERDYRLVGEKAAELAKQILVDGKKVKDLKVVTVDYKVN